MSVSNIFYGEDLDDYFRELAREYRRRMGRSVKAELVLVGGASILINYGFRDTTTDIDAIISAPSVMKEAIRAVGDRFDLPEGWLNSDFRKTDSFTAKLIQFSSFYKTFMHVLDVRTVKDEHLIAMKLVAGRQYKRDLSDIVGVITECRRAGRPLSYEDIDKAMIDLYGGWSRVDEAERLLLDKALTAPDYDALRERVMDMENKAFEELKATWKEK
jgi:hypothetical protein